MDNILNAIQRLLDSRPPQQRGGFVIFQGNRELDYVQFALDANGMLLNWPSFQKEGPERLPMFHAQLEQRGFRQLRPDAGDSEIWGQIHNLQPGEFMILDDGLLCANRPRCLEEP